MEVYAEYLFIENFAAGFFILLLTARICGRAVTRRRLLLGSALCGMYSFVLLLENMNTILWVGIKIIFSIVLITIVFTFFPGKKERRFGQLKNGFKILLTFYIISFVMGGITIAGLYFFKTPGAAAGGAVYIGDTTYPQVTAGIMITYLAGSAFAKFIKDRVRSEKVYKSATVELGGESWRLKAMVDTGNFLRDPKTGRPVAIICQSAADEILKSRKVGHDRFSAIPYKSIGLEGGILVGIRVDRVTMEDTVIRDMILAVYEGEFNAKGDGESYRLLLHRDLLEGGIAVNA